MSDAIPSTTRIRYFWKLYDLPKNKRKHSALVAKVANFLANRCALGKSGCSVNIKLLVAASLLHDIDKNAKLLFGEKHPDAAVRILKAEGMDEIAGLVAKHPLHTILDEELRPKTLEEKILFLADKMVKYDIITVDERFRLWRDESWSDAERRILRAAYPKVKALEKELLYLAGIGSSGQVAKLVMEEYTDKKKEVV